MFPGAVFLQSCEFHQAIEGEGQGQDYGSGSRVEMTQLPSSFEGTWLTIGTR